MQEINQRLVRTLKAIELIIAVLLIIAICIASIVTFVDGTQNLLNETFSLDFVLEKALTLVVGVEFVKMLILHTPESVIEVLLYAVARQIIITHTSSALENLFGVLAIAVIFVVKKYLLGMKDNKC